MAAAQIASSAEQPRRIHKSLWTRDEGVRLVESTVGSLLAQRAKDRANALALVGNAHGTGEQWRLSYAELYDKSLQVARALLRIAQPGEFVALWAPNVIEWPIIQYGAALAGMPVVALNPVLREQELLFALDHSRAGVLVHADRSRGYDLGAVVRSVRKDCTHLRHVVSLSEWDSWLTAETGGDATLPKPDPDSVAMLQYTSGTTGTPKGVVLRHRSLVNVAKLTMETAGVSSGAIGVNPLPMFHTAGCVVATLGPLWLGGCTVLVERFEPNAVLELIRRENATLLFSVPTILGALLEIARDSSNVPKVHTVMGGAANVPRVMIENAEELFGASVHNLFGQTELSPVLSMTRPGDSHHDLVHTVGKPLPQVDCKIVDTVTGEVQPLGRSGEICARGYQQLVEYLYAADETARTVDSDGWVHTGDLGSMDERGVITLTGRLKDLIVRGGENIAPAEIESCLVEQDQVLDAAVFGVPDDRWGEIVGAAIRLRGERSSGLPAALEAHCRERLAPYKVPENWFVVEEFPMTPTGKVQKFQLTEAAAAGRLIPLR